MPSQRLTHKPAARSARDDHLAAGTALAGQAGSGLGFARPAGSGGAGRLIGSVQPGQHVAGARHHQSHVGRQHQAPAVGGSRAGVRKEGRVIRACRRRHHPLQGGPAVGNRLHVLGVSQPAAAQCRSPIHSHKGQRPRCGDAEGGRQAEAERRHRRGLAGRRARRHRLPARAARCRGQPAHVLLARVPGHAQSCRPRGRQQSERGHWGSLCEEGGGQKEVADRCERRCKCEEAPGEREKQGPAARALTASVLAAPAPRPLQAQPSTWQHPAAAFLQHSG